MRVIGDNSAGFDNEKQISSALNNHLYDSINANLRHFLDDMFKGYSLKGKWVHATTISQRMKPDFYVTVDGVPEGRYVSVKMGTGNSLHQESLESLVTFLENEGVPPHIIENLKRYHWSDGTDDNTGLDRLPAKTFAKNNPAIVSSLNEYLNSEPIRSKLIERFIFVGNYPNAPAADYLYHGTPHSGVWASREEIVNYTKTLVVDKNCVSIGPLTYQAWNKNLERNPKAEYKRRQMQVKWGKLADSIVEVTSRRCDYMMYGTYEGDLSEKASVISFNRNPESSVFSSYLKSIHMNPDNVLLIRVTTNQLSRLSNQRVKTRADAYAIEIVDPRIYDLLEENGFYLDEDILNGYDEYYRCVEKSGISIKRDNSENYTLIKLTPNSFNELFGTYVLGYGASIFCKNGSELHYNIPLLDGWHVTVEDLQDYFDSTLITKESLVTSLEMCKNIKDECIKRIKTTIDGSLRLQSIIFNGKDIYDEPYSAFFFMQNNTIKTLGYIPYAVTTGSGRSHGDYSLVLKPR